LIDAVKAAGDRRMGRGARELLANMETVRERGHAGGRDRDGTARPPYLVCATHRQETRPQHQRPVRLGIGALLEGHNATEEVSLPVVGAPCHIVRISHRRPLRPEIISSQPPTRRRQGSEMRRLLRPFLWTLLLPSPNTSDAEGLPCYIAKANCAAMPR